MEENKRPNFCEQDNWHERFLDLAKYIASWSKDKTKVGAVIVNNRRILATGYNGPTLGIDDNDPDVFTRPQKYLYCEHAERNAIYSSAKNGISLLGADLYVTGRPCADCARAIVSSGLGCVIYPKNNDFQTNNEVRDRWIESIEIGEKILKAGKVGIINI